MDEESDKACESTSFIPEDVLKEAETAIKNLLPEKSKSVYEKEYQLFCNWRSKRNVRGISEPIILAYISEKSKYVKASTLWSYFSMLKATLKLKEKTDISRFGTVVAFLKKQSSTHKPKKSKIFTGDEVNKFLCEAPDDTYLLIKIATIMGIGGGCRSDELLKMKIDDIKDRGSVLVVSVPDTKTKKSRVFTIVDEEKNSISYLALYRKYVELRPKDVPHNRLFIFYKRSKCTIQPVGKNTFSKFPRLIAEFLGLSDATLYTGHCFRRSSASFLVEAGGDLLTLKNHGGWKSSSVAEGYLEQSLTKKEEICKKIFSRVTVEKKDTFENNPVNNAMPSTSKAINNAGCTLGPFINCTFNITCSENKEN